MSSLRYKDYYISVFHIPDKAGGFSCRPCVEIRHKLDTSPTTRLLFEESFAAGQAATTHGVEFAKQWIDAKKDPRARPQPAGESQSIRVAFKAWIVSRLARFF